MRTNRILALLVAACAFGLFAPPDAQATYSIVARDPKTGEVGVAVQSHWFGVGRIVSWAEAGVGAVATQAAGDPTYGKVGLDLMRVGRPAPEALKGLLAADVSSDIRQVGIIDAQGRVAAHTGQSVIAHAGHVVSDDFAVQANLMASEKVWPAMAKAFREAKGDLAARMLAALEAAQAQGGDARGKQSASLIVVAAKATGQPWKDRVFDLRVEDHPEPVEELRRLVALQRAYNALAEGDAAVAAGDGVKAKAAYARAVALAPGSAELHFWYAVGLVTLGERKAALPLFKKAFALEPAFRALVPKVAKAKILPEEKAFLQQVTAQ